MRKCALERVTKETEIKLYLDIDGSGSFEGNSGIGFLDHMLELFTRHGGVDMRLYAGGDLQVDTHHTMEDIGIVLGQAIAKALGKKEGITRYGNVFLPMDECLAQVSMDMSGRGYLHFDCPFTREKIGDLETEMVREFFRAVAMQAGMTLHMTLHYGENNHHMAEALFKGFGRCLRQAVTIDPEVTGVPSTKGVL